MKKIALSLFLAIFVFALPQTVSTSPGSEGSYVFELKWGSSGSGDGLFNMPRSVAVDSSGNVYVADTSNHRIQKFDSVVGFIGWIGRDNLGTTGWHNPGTGTRGVFGTGDGQFWSPWGVAVDLDNNVYVADTTNQRIQKFDSDGGFLGWIGLDNKGDTGWHPPGTGTYGMVGLGDGEFYNPYDVAVDLAGYIYVVDTYSHRIQKFDSDGGFLGWIGLDNFGFTGWHNPETGTRGVSGSGDGQFYQPRGVAVDSEGNVYVADASNHRIQKFDSFGVFLGWWGRDNGGNTGWHNPGSGTVGAYGTGDGQFRYPWGVGVDLDDDIYVADTQNQRFQKFDSSGALLGWWGMDNGYFTGWHPPGTGAYGILGTDDGEFWLPYDVAVDLDGNVYVVDSFNRRIQKFDFVPPLGVKSPNSGEIWLTNTIHDITWETGVGNDYVKIEFSDNNGTDWEEIVASTENDGLYEDWYVPCNLSAECLVRITGLDDLLSDVSDDVFSIESSTPPVITLIGLPEIVLECGIDTYEEPGADAEDGCSNDVPVVIKGDEVDTMTCGIYVITYDAIDLSGQAATQEIRTVIVRDTIPPDPDMDPLPTVSGECSVTVTTTPTATDNCAGVITGTTTDPISYSKKGTYTVLWTYDDLNGNITTQTQTVTVDDKTLPVPDLADLPDVKGECSAAIMTAPTATDNCAGIITGTTTKELPIVFNEQGTHTVTWIYDDGNENTTTQTQTVIVEDITPPVPDAETLPTVEGECSAKITTAPTAKDNCAGIITGTTTDPLEYTKSGTYTVTWVYDDGNGNTATQTQTVKVEDITPPTIQLSDSTCVNINKWKIANMLTVSASDNCSSDVELALDKVKILNKHGRQVWGRGIYSVVGNDIYVFPNGRDWSIVVTVTASDSNGNTKTESLSKPLLQCNRWSAKMARLIRLLYILIWKWHRCW
jgi:hypothetical protein